MKTSKSLAELYQLIKKTGGKPGPRQFVGIVVQNAIGDMEDEGLEVTPEELEKRILESVNDLITAAKKTNVA